MTFVAPRKVIFHGLAPTISLKLFAVTIDIPYTIKSALMATVLAKDLKQIAAPGGRNEGWDRQTKPFANLKGIAVELFEPGRISHRRPSRSLHGDGLKVLGSHYRSKTPGRSGLVGSNDDSAPHKIFPCKTVRYVANLVAVSLLEDLTSTAGTLAPQG
jgi:hypothetical protein